MPSFTLNGIPISDEQCIGDSLEIINNAFLGLSSNIGFTNADIASLATVVNKLSTTNVTVATTSAFTLQPVHNNSIIVCKNTSPLIISIANNATFDLAHKTTFIQANVSKVVFGALSGTNPFSVLDGNTAIAGRYGVATARFVGTTTMGLSTKGWVVDGDLAPAIQPVKFLKLVAAPSPGAEDVPNDIAITGPIADTLFYYPTPNLSATPSFMDVYVNGFYRTTVDFTEDRLGTTFGYSLAGVTGNSPQVTGKFAKQARVDFMIDGGNPVFRNLTASPSPGSEDTTFGGNLSITGQKKDTIYYYADVKRTDMTPTYLDVYVNGFYRTTVDFQRGRLGTQFGYKTEESFGGSQATGTFIDGEMLGSGLDAVYFNIPGALQPTTTELVASTAPGNNSDSLKIRFTAISSSYTDTLAVFPWPGQSAAPVTADIYIDGVYRTTIDYTEDRIGDKFWYRLAGVSGPSYQAEGVFAAQTGGSAVRIDLSISGAPPLPTATPGPTATPSPTPRPSATPEPTSTPAPTPGPVIYQLTAKPSIQGGSDDDLNAISIRSVILTDDYNDTISYRPLQLANMIPADPMDIYVNGIHRTTIDFPEGRKGTSFEYRLYNSQTIGSGIFNSGRVNIGAVVPPTPTPAPTAPPLPTPPPLGGTIWNITAKTPDGEGNYFGSGSSTAPENLIGPGQPDETLSITSPYINEVLYGNALATPNYQLGVMLVYVNGEPRANVQFDKARIGTTFYYKKANSSTTYTGTFVDGDRFL